MSPGMVSSQGTSLDEAIKLSLPILMIKSKTSKLLILVSDGEDHSEGPK
jgi:Ca-activated chloride channel family protein